MAVPKRKTSPSRRGMRRAHKGLRPINVIIDSESGEYKLPHQMSMPDGTYNKKQILVKRVAEEDTDE